MAGYKAFQSKFMGSELLFSEDYVAFESRKLRYSILWAMYENTAYSKMHAWAQGYKSEYGLYKYIRNIYNPSYRIGEFWKAHLLGGQLDAQAGDGTKVPSCLPILTDNDALREAIAQIWAWSNWQVKKDILGLWTPVMGDGVIKIVDNPDKQKVYMTVLNPGTLKYVDLDPFGNVKGYVLEERRRDPRKGRNNANSTSISTVTYREVAERNGDSVVYSTYLDDGLYAWNENQGAQWEESYGFVPLVVFQHNNVGLDFGWAELYPGLPKFREVDDQASKLNDQIRKLVDTPMLMAGVTKPGTQPQVAGAEKTDDKPQPGREEVPYIYTANADAKAIPLVGDLNIADTSTHIQTLLAEIEQDYPELSADLHNVQGDISGRALRLNRAPAEDKVIQRRPNYDDAIVRAQKMAVSIGGMRNYFPFSLDSFNAGDLEHSIGKRPVFAKDPQDDIDEETAFWAAANQAKAFGIPPLVYLRQKGWSDEKIADIEKSPEYMARIKALENLNIANSTPPTNDPFKKKQASQ